MNGEKLQDAAREMAEELPASAVGHPFGPEHEVYKVKGTSGPLRRSPGVVRA